MENAPSTPKDPEERHQRPVAPEANRLHSKDLPPERIGHVLVSADTQSARLGTAERLDKLDKPEKKPAQMAAVEQQAATMSRRELLALSEEITVDNTTLRHIYDTHLIGENGLRRLVSEHLHGGNLKEALHHEILEHETDFERDPQLRDQSLRRDQQAEELDLDNLLAKAGIVESVQDGEPAAAKLPAAHLAQHLDQQARQRKLLDFVFIIIILVLFVLVVMLAMSRG